MATVEDVVDALDLLAGLKEVDLGLTSDEEQTPGLCRLFPSLFSFTRGVHAEPETKGDELAVLAGLE